MPIHFSSSWLHVSSEPENVQSDSQILTSNRRFSIDFLILQLLLFLLRPSRLFFSYKWMNRAPRPQELTKHGLVLWKTVWPLPCLTVVQDDSTSVQQCCQDFGNNILKREYMHVPDHASFQHLVKHQSYIHRSKCQNTLCVLYIRSGRAPAYS